MSLSVMPLEDKTNTLLLNKSKCVKSKKKCCVALYCSFCSVTPQLSAPVCECVLLIVTAVLLLIPKLWGHLNRKNTRIAYNKFALWLIIINYLVTTKNNSFLLKSRLKTAHVTHRNAVLWHQINENNNELTPSNKTQRQAQCCKNAEY